MASWLKDATVCGCASSSGLMPKGNLWLFGGTRPKVIQEEMSSNKADSYQLKRVLKYRKFNTLICPYLTG